MFSQGWDYWCESQVKHPKRTLQQVLKPEPIAASPGQLGKIKLDGLLSEILIHRSVWGLGICISNKVGDAGAGLGTSL